jgi:hypothetical protein
MPMQASDRVAGMPSVKHWVLFGGGSQILLPGRDQPAESSSTIPTAAAGTAYPTRTPAVQVSFRMGGRPEDATRNFRSSFEGARLHH